MNQPLDYLVFAPHPDDGEIGVGGTLLKAVEAGKRVGIIDLTRGERGTKGTAEIRDAEAKAASDLLKLHVRENLDLGDARLCDSDENRLAVVEAIRKHRARYVFICPPYDRHPDHQGASRLVESSFFLSRLPKVETASPAHSPERFLYYFIHDFRDVTFAVDITSYHETKQNVLACYRSQFIDPSLPPHYRHIGTHDYLAQVEAYNRTVGAKIGVSFAEGFAAPQPLAPFLPDECE